MGTKGTGRVCPSFLKIKRQCANELEVTMALDRGNRRFHRLGALAVAALGLGAMALPLAPAQAQIGFGCGPGGCGGGIGPFGVGVGSPYYADPYYYRYPRDAPYSRPYYYP